uniref:Vomeronasal type-1 receptor n=1 Tax=Prolemur simus TaxID=1328070 RepID=A0A8C8Z714_PROSS
NGYYILVESQNIKVIPDAMFIGLMVWTSGSMVHLLQRHRLKLQHVHTTSHRDRCPPETRATHTVLMLMVTFVVFYMLNSIFTLCITAVADARVWLMRTTDVLISCFPTVCPFVLILRAPRTPRFCS